jgi:hypothetical protein
MTTHLTVLGNEVEIIAWNIDILHKRSPETRQSSFNVVKLES